MGTFVGKKLIYIFTLMILFSNIFATNASGYGIWWTFQGDPEIFPGETIEIDVYIYNDYYFKINVTLTIYDNESRMKNSDIPLDPTGWYGKLNETNFIIDPQTAQNTTLQITAPRNAECDQEYRVFLRYYAEPTFSSEINDTDEVSVGVTIKCEEKNIIYLIRRNRKVIPVSVRELALLKQAAIHQELQSTGFQKIGGPCHLTRGTQEFQFHDNFCCFDD